MSRSRRLSVSRADISRALADYDPIERHAGGWERRGGDSFAHWP